MMKKLGLVCVLLCIYFFPGALAVENTTGLADVSEVHLHLFYGQGCPHCAQARQFIRDIESDYPSLVVHEHEVYSDMEGRELFMRMSAEHDVEIQGVPTFFIDGKVIVGFSNAIGESIEEEIMRCVEMDCGNPEDIAQVNDTISVEDNSSSSEVPANDPLNTTVNEDNISKGSVQKENGFSQRLTVPIVMAAAAVDAINPCAFAVLIILMTAALSIGNKKKALKFGIAFTISIYISYFLMGLGLFSALQATGISHTFYIIVTILAVVVGLLNVKDYFWYGKGFLMEVPLSWRPTMKKILNSATSPLGAFIAGFAVSLFELPCTGGPYIVILGLLAKEVTRQVGILYLLLYNLVFVAPLIILTLVITRGLSTTEKLEQIRQEKIRLLHLIGGILMLSIAVVMILSLVYGWV